MAESPSSVITPLLRQSRHEPPQDSFHAAKISFFILGIGMLFPWNAFITCVEMWQFKFQGTAFEYTFENWFSIAYMVMNLIGVLISLMQRSKKLDTNLTRFSLVLNVATFTLIAMLAKANIDPHFCFGLALMLVMLVGLTTAIIGSNLIAMSSLFDSGIFTQMVFTGQGLAGFTVAMSNFLIRLYFLLNNPNNGLPPPADQLITASIYFYFSAVICAISLVSYLILHELPIFKYYTQPDAELLKPSSFSCSSSTCEVEDALGEEIVDSDRKATMQLPITTPSAWTVFGKIKREALSTFMIFFTTLMLFPSYTSTIVSHNPSSSNPTKWAKLYTTLFPTSSFVLFNLSDFLSRFLPSVPKLSNPSFSTLHSLSLLRLAFIPIFLLCNTTYTSFLPLPTIPFLKADMTFFALLVLLAAGNGYLGGMLMMLTPKKEGITIAERQLAGRVMNFTLLFGLSSGAIASFGLRAVMCGCNPFV